MPKLKAKETKREEQISIRVTSSELRRITRRAKASGLSPGAWLRMIGLESIAPKEVKIESAAP